MSAEYEMESRKHLPSYPFAEVQVELDWPGPPGAMQEMLLTVLIGAIVRSQDPLEHELGHGGFIPIEEIPTVAALVVADAMATGFGHYVADEIGDPHRVTDVHILRHPTYWRVCAKRCLVHFS